MILDTDVLIWYMKGNKKAYSLVESLDGFSISVVTYMELVQGMRNKRELQELRKAIKAWNARILYITEEISTRASLLVEKHFLNHSLYLADALIAATAITYSDTLCTGNQKHFNMITELDTTSFIP